MTTLGTVGLIGRRAPYIKGYERLTIFEYDEYVNRHGEPWPAFCRKLAEENPGAIVVRHPKNPEYSAVYLKI